MIKTETELKIIENFQKPLNKLLKELSKEGITFSPVDGELDNVIFKQGDKEIRIKHNCFYRLSGLVNISKDGKEKNSIILVKVTDEMWLQNFMKPIILLRLEKE